MMRTLGVAFATLWLAGCVGPVKDTFNDRAEEYKSSYTLDPIQLPAEFNVDAPLEAFPIEGVDGAVAGIGGQGFRVPEVPAGDPSLQVAETLLLESDRLAFLRIDALPEEVWPELTTFFDRNGVGIVADRNRARIESGWLAGTNEGRTNSNLLRYLPAADQGWRRISIDVAPGLAEDSTEIRAQMWVNGSVVRPAQNAQADEFDGKTMSAWMDEFSIWLADAKQSGRRVSAVGLGQGAEPRITRAVLDDGSLAIRVKTEPTTAWDGLVQAVERTDFVTEYADPDGLRVQGRYVSEGDRRRLAELNLLTRALVLATEDLAGLYQINAQLLDDGVQVDVQFLGQGGSVAIAEELLLQIAQQIL